MCGIAGFWDKKNNTRDNMQDIITKMKDALIHRGPNDSGIYIDKTSGVALGHRRLSILDLSPKGNQPMESFSGRYIIVYNGEVYNYIELRQIIQKDFNIEFVSNSDTELILSAIEVFGIEDSISKFIGMFSFALWDKKDKKLYLVRDRIGIKPLYYGIQDNILYFASELKAIVANRYFKPNIDIDSLALYFRHNYIPFPYSIYKDIKKLTPGHYAVIDENLDIKIKCYWDVKKITVEGINNRLNLPEEELTIELEKLLLDSVKKRMISDVPLGAFLSGGVDSSTVVALMQAQTTIPVKTFTIGFYEDSYNEAKFAKKVANYLKTDHTELYITPKETMDVIYSLPEMYDEPFSDASQIPTFLVSKLARKHVTVTLSGDGGDELFGGYNRYFWAQNIWNKTRNIPNNLKSCISKLIISISPEILDNVFEKLEFMLPKKYRQTLYGDKLHKLAEILSSRSDDEIYKRLISHWKNPEEFVIGSREPHMVFDDPNINAKIPDFRERMMFFDLVTYLPEDILTKVDRASMYVSLEARVPILDHRVVEFSKKIPLGCKIKGNKTKWILRQILYKYVPQKLIERPKMGFGIPIDRWLRGPLREWSETLLNEKKIKQDSILEPGKITRLWKEHLSKKRNHQYLLWDILMFQAWKHRWIDS